MKQVSFYPVNNKNVIVVGMAKSGLAVARLLATQGAKVFVTDIMPAKNLRDAVAQLQKFGIAYETGGHSGSMLTRCDFIVLSPGVPETITLIQSAAQKGIPFYSEVEVASWFCKSEIVAVTGSNGKTTTTSLIGDIFKSKYPDTFVGGNIGTPFSEEMMKGDQPEFAVLELSSFQLANIETFHPHIGLLLNFTPDHLDRHKSFDSYVDAKMNISLNQTAHDFLVVNADDELVAERVDMLRVQKIPFSASGKKNALVYLKENAVFSRFDGGDKKIADFAELRLRGMHNYLNAAAATAAAQCAGIEREYIHRALMSFWPIEHRIEFVKEVAGVKYFNDSKATNSDAAKQALMSFKEPLLLLAGGYAKEFDYSHLAGLAHEKVKLFCFFGKDREKLCNDLNGRPGENAFLFQTLDEAVQFAAQTAKSGETVLLSPMCASFDSYSSYEERGRHFKKLVHNLTEKNER